MIERIIPAPALRTFNGTMTGMIVVLMAGITTASFSSLPEKNL
jgi:hypothetical protein